MKVQTSVKAGGRNLNHNETRAVKVQTGVKAGALTSNHNETVR